MNTRAHLFGIFFAASLSGCVGSSSSSSQALEVCQDLWAERIEDAELAVVYGEPEGDGDEGPSCDGDDCPGFLLEEDLLIEWQVCHDEPGPGDDDGDGGGTGTGSDAGPIIVVDDPYGGDTYGSAGAAPPGGQQPAPMPQPPPQPPAKVTWPPDPARSVLVGEDRYVVGRTRDDNGKFAEVDITIKNTSTKEVRIRFAKADHAKAADAIDNIRRYYFEPFKPNKDINFDVGTDVTIPAGQTKNVKAYGLTVVFLAANNGVPKINETMVLPTNVLAPGNGVDAKMTPGTKWLEKTITLTDK